MARQYPTRRTRGTGCTRYGPQKHSMVIVEKSQVRRYVRAGLYLPRGSRESSLSRQYMLSVALWTP